MYAKEPNDYKPLDWDLNNLPMLPDKFETKKWSRIQVSKAIQIIKSFRQAELVINCGMPGKKVLIQRWVMNEANYIEASSAFVDFIADHQTIKEFQN
jgi:DNA topoisomerase-3